MEENSANTEAALSLLINLSGKMRMLSHRVALAAQQSLLSPESRMPASVTYTSALEAFAATYRALQYGDAALGISAEAAALAVQSGAMEKSIRLAVERFLSEAHRFQGSIVSGEVDVAKLNDFTIFVTEELLLALNKITDAVGNALQTRLDAQRANGSQARDAMLAAVRSIGDVSKKVKLISLNASIEAARAREFGKGFSVIAQEIRALSESAAHTSSLLEDYVRKLT